MWKIFNIFKKEEEPIIITSKQINWEAVMQDIIATGEYSDNNLCFVNIDEHYGVCRSTGGYEDYLDLNSNGMNYWPINHRYFEDCKGSRSEAVLAYKKATPKIVKVKHVKRIGNEKSNNN